MGAGHSSAAALTLAFLNVGGILVQCKEPLYESIARSETLDNLNGWVHGSLLAVQYRS
jgi:hypothetical protein